MANCLTWALKNGIKAYARKVGYKSLSVGLYLLSQSTFLLGYFCLSFIYSLQSLTDYQTKTKFLVN